MGTSTHPYIYTPLYLHTLTPIHMHTGTCTKQDTNFNSYFLV